MSHPAFRTALGVLGCGILLWAANGAEGPRGIPNSAATPAKEDQLARQVCSGCHRFPDPDLLDRQTWEKQILPRMETRLGVSPPDYSSSPEGELLKKLELYPREPLISRDDWQKIVNYYLALAPVSPLAQEAHPQIRIGLELFHVELARFRFSPPLTTVVQIGASEGRIYLGDDGARRLAVLDGKGAAIGKLAVNNVPVGVHETREGIYVTCIGSFIPSETQRGALLFYPKEKGLFGPPRVIVDGLPRVAQTEFADFDGDNRIDFAMCLFGNHRGRFSWFQNLGGDQYRERVLVEKAGAIHCLARDLNADGSIDLALLMAQESESFQVLTNDAKGGFGFRMVFQRPPVFGHNYFELADFDRDGIDDLLVANGDNGEFQSPPKRYHGLRIYRGLGGGRFEDKEAYFFPLNGATKAVARDFDNDGDADMAAIAFFPDYERSPRESFVFLENQGGLKFAPSTFSQCIAGRWLTLDVGDLDGDGDLDLVLGSYIRGPTAVPAFLSRTWEKDGPSLLILRNQLR